MALDKKGTLYLGDQCLNQVEEYSKGSTTLKRTITDGSSAPTGIAIDKSGTLYVSELGSSEIEEVRRRQHIADQDDNRHVGALWDLAR